MLFHLDTFIIGQQLFDSSLDLFLNIALLFGDDNLNLDDIIL